MKIDGIPEITVAVKEILVGTPFTMAVPMPDA
jgi:hypothetical protein